MGSDDRADECTGGYTCAAAVHGHGCYADMGSCDAPEEHLRPNGVAPDRLNAIKGRVLRAKHRDHEQRVIVDIDDLLALFSERDRAIRRARKFKWLYRRQNGHMRKLVEHFQKETNDA